MNCHLVIPTLRRHLYVVKSSRWRQLLLQVTDLGAHCTVSHVKYILPVFARLLNRHSFAGCRIRRLFSYICSLCFVKHVVHVFLFSKKYVIASRLRLQLEQNLFSMIGVPFVTRVLLGNSTIIRSPPSSSHRARSAWWYALLPSWSSKELFVTFPEMKARTSSATSEHVSSSHDRAAIAVVVVVVAGVCRMGLVFHPDASSSLVPPFACLPCVHA